FLFKDADKLLPDDLALAFGGFHTGQFAVETLAGVHADKVDIEPAALAKDLTDLFPLVFAKQAMIHEHAGELLADRLGQHGGAHAGVHTAGKRTEDLATADFLAQRLNGILHKRIHLPGARAAANIIHKIVQHPGAVFGVQDLGMELHTVQSAGRVL